ncbi:MAG: outer membrane protein assembly factor BamD [Steroidobacteraceae bacterium]
MPQSVSRRTLLLLPVSLAVLSACASTAERRRARLFRATPEGLYAEGKKSLRSGDFAQAIRTYEALVARYPFTGQARQARLDLIYAYYRAGEKESATDAADTFIRENPTHPRIDYAWYLKGLIDFGKVPNVVERWMRVDYSERAPTTARSAFDAFRIVVERFPQSAYAGDARQRMIYLRNRLADYEMQVASYYIERGAWVAAAQRAKQTIEQYDGAPAVKNALRVLVRSYRELGYNELADNAEKVFKENYPGESLQNAARKGGWWKFWS